MRRVYRGKTKDVYALENGNYLLKFKDDVTGENGIFDPGSNRVGLTIDGAGRAGLRLSAMFFQLLEKRGVRTHYVDDHIESNSMIVKPAAVFGRGVEVICRYRCVGSFLRRYGLYAEEGQQLDAFVEFTLKDDGREDPPITEDALEMLGLISAGESRAIKEETKKICGIIKDELGERGIELYDIKLEFGRLESSGDIVLIDEISGGNMRAYQKGHCLEPLALERILLSRDKPII